MGESGGCDICDGGMLTSVSVLVGVVGDVGGRSVSNSGDVVMSLEGGVGGR